MRLRSHQHRRPCIDSSHPLAGKTLYIPAMEELAARTVAAAFRWIGIDACVTPPSNDRTLELGNRFTEGDECYPAKVSFGDLLRVVEQPGFDPKRTAFLMTAADGPCRFGQYVICLGRVLRQQGYGDVQIVSPHDKNGYADFGTIAGPLLRTAWRAVVCSDALRRLLLKTRPYELHAGDTDAACAAAADDLCATLESSCGEPACQMQQLVACMMRARDRFRRVAAHYDKEKPLIAVVGEIFCRLNAFSNQDLIRCLEEAGAETSLSGVSEWIQYTNADEAFRLRLTGRRLSGRMLKAVLRRHFQHSDEHALLAPLHDDFVGYDEPEVDELLTLAEPYLPAYGVCGEMVMSAGKAAFVAKNGYDGVIDISPFTCMNGTVSEAIYPRLSKDYGGIPIRNFYFDGTQSELSRDLVVFLDLAQSYRERKPAQRRYPAYFDEPSTTDAASPACGACEVAADALTEA